MSRHRTAVCTWSLQPTSPAALAEAVRAAGLDAIQLGLSPIVSDPHVWGDAIETLRDAGLTIVSGMMAMEGEDYSSLESIAETGGVRPDASWSDNREHAVAVARVAGAAGIGLVSFHAGFIPEDGDAPHRQVLIDRLRAVADIFAAEGVNLAFETGQETAAALLEALEAIDRLNIGVNFDPANMILYGMGDPVAAARDLSDHIVQVHIKDATPTNTPGTWGAEVPAGTGAVDWPAFLAVIDDLNRPIDLVIEREAGGSRVDDIKTAAELVAR